MTGRLRTWSVLKAVDRADVLMIERREDLGFAAEARDALRVSGEQGRQDLDRDLAFELRVLRAIDLAHAARAERGDDFVGTEACAGSECQVGGLYGRSDETNG